MSVTYERTEEQIEIDAIVLARVKAGIEFLQEEYGEDWVDKIDLRKLNLKEGSRCVLGQVYGDYGRACDKFGWSRLKDEPVSHGFLIENWKAGNYAKEDDWAQLQAAWEQEIAALITGGDDA